MSKFFKDALTVTIGNSSAQLISVLTIPVITRIYSPEEYGAYNLFLALVMFFLPISSWRYNAALMLPRNNARAFSLFIISLIAVVSTVIMCVIGLQLAEKLNIFPEIWAEKDMSLILWIIPIVILINGIGQIGLFWCTRIGQFRTIAVSRVYETLFDRVIAVVVGVMGGLSWGLYVGRLIGSVAYTVSVLRGSFKNKARIPLRIIKKKYLLMVAERYKSFPKYSTWSFFVDGLSRHGPLIIMAYYYSPALIGFYALAVQILGMPMVFIGDALSNVFLKQAVKFKEDKKNLQKLVYIIIKMAIYFLLPMILVLLSRGSDLFSVVFGAKWSVAGELIGVLSIAIISMFLHRVLGCLFEVYEHLKTRLAFDALLFVSRLIAAFLVSSHGFSIYVLVLVLALLNLIIYLLAIIYLFRLIGFRLVQLKKIAIDCSFYLLPIFVVFLVDVYYLNNNLLAVFIWFVALLCSSYIIYSKERKLFMEIR